MADKAESLQFGSLDRSHAVIGHPVTFSQTSRGSCQYSIFILTTLMTVMTEKFDLYVTKGVRSCRLGASPASHTSHQPIGLLQFLTVQSQMESKNPK